MSILARLLSWITQSWRWFQKACARLGWGRCSIQALPLKGREGIEKALLQIDFGAAQSASLLQAIKDRGLLEITKKGEKACLENLEQLFIERLEAASKTSPDPIGQSLEANPEVVLLVGVNGAGKTTTLAKLALHYQQKGAQPLMACADTFRAGAWEQLKHWGERLEVPVVGHAQARDAAAIAYDALQATRARGCNPLLLDTAGRLQQPELAKELQKVARTLKKLDQQAPHQIWLVLDAPAGQSAFHQVEWFQRALPLTGMILTKLDGRAQGGMALNLMERFQLPLKFIGTGEAAQDLIAFTPQILAHRWAVWIQQQAQK